MPFIVACPQCTSPLGLPAGADQAAQAQCPYCGNEFLLSTAVPRELVDAKILTSSPPSDSELDLSEEHDIEMDEADETRIPLSHSEFAAAVPADLKTTPRGPRRAAGLGSLVGIVGGGAVGLFLGAYALLWIRGPEGDIAGLAKWLPPVLLPESVQNAADFDFAN